MPVTFTFGEMLSARSVIGTTLAELGEDYPNLWVLTPDIGATLVEFRDKFPERFLDVGLAEQVCVGIAAGLAYDGNIPVVSGMLPFLSMRALEQVRIGCLLPEPAGQDHRHARRAGRQRRLDPLRGRGPRAHVRPHEHDRHLDRRPGDGRRDPAPVDDDGGPDLHPSRRRQDGQGALRAGRARRSGSARGSSPARAPTPRSSRTALWSRRRSTPPRSSEKDGRSVRVVDMFTLKPIDEELIARVRRRDRRPVRGPRGPPRLRRARDAGWPTSSPIAASASPPSSGSASRRSTPDSATTRSCATSTATAWRRRSPPPAG